MLKKVICGFQTGIDIASAKAAKAAGFETSGWMTFGLKTEDGVKPEYVSKFGALQISSRKYPDRTFKNVQESDYTLFIGTNLNSPGYRCTWNAACDLRKPVLPVLITPYASGGFYLARIASRTYGQQYPLSGAAVAMLMRDLSLFIKSPNYVTLNIAGNRSKDLEAPVEAFLTAVFAKIKAAQEGRA